MTYCVEAYGAVGDGNTDNTAFLQAVIDQCSRDGGGRVVLSSGTYLSGTIELKSNVELRLEADAVLKAIRDEDRFPEIPCMLARDGCSENPNEERKGYAFVYAYRAQGVQLSGSGTIDVGGEWFQGRLKRPFLLRIIECSAVRVTGLTLRQAAAWCCHVQRSRDVEMEHLTIRSSKIRNGDGLDIDSSSDVTVSECDIRTCDDALCLKTTTAAPCRNIRVTDCVLSSHCSGVKVGSESVGDFSDIHIARCTLNDCRVVALKVTAVDGGSVNKVSFSDLEIDNSTGPIFIATGNRGRRYTDEADPERRSLIRDVSFENMNITTRRYERSDGGVIMYDRGQGIVVSGRPDQVIRDVRFENLRTDFWGGVSSYDGDPDEVPVLEDQYPECHKLGVLPSYGYYFQYAENVTVKCCTEGLINSDVRPVRWVRT